MNKELNPDLFGERKIVRQQAPEKTTYAASTGTAENAHLNIDRQIFELRSQSQQTNEQISKMIAGINELTKSSNVKFDRLQQALSRLEQNHNGLAYETGQKVTHLSQKLIERKSLDQKIQEMVDRHNNIVKSFEVRMNHLQKLLAEKDAQVIAAHAALNEAKMEIARLKRF